MRKEKDGQLQKLDSEMESMRESLQKLIDEFKSELIGKEGTILDYEAEILSLNQTI